MDYKQIVKEIVEKIFKRFLKEKGIYGSNEGKGSIRHLRNYKHIFMPLNFFRWDTSIQGHMYWFNMSIDWCIFLFDAAKNLENSEERTYLMKFSYSYLDSLLENYLPSDLNAMYKDSLTYQHVKLRKMDMESALANIINNN